MSTYSSLSMVPRSLSSTKEQSANARILKSSAGAPLALVEDDALLPPEKPISGPEVDDLNRGSRPHGESEVDDMVPSQSSPSDYPGVDDALIPRRDNRPRQPFPVPEDPSFSEEQIPGKGLPDVNVYQQKKTFAQGMMDLALLTANANQLRYVLDAGSTHTYYYVTLSFILISIILQVVVGILLLWNSRFNINKEHHIVLANRINNFTVIGIFLITILNVFITAFGLPDRSLVLASQVAKEDVESINNAMEIDIQKI